MKDDELGRLIAGRNAPSVLEKEQLFEQIYARVQGAPERRSLRAWLPALLAGAAALAAAAFFVARPSEPEFRARGSADVVVKGPELAVSCAAAEGCRIGGKLSFAVQANGTGYFAAFARRADGTIIWYFPEPLGQSLVLSQTSERTLLDRAVLLGPEHLPGHYEVYGVFSRQPLTREQLKLKVGQELAGGADATVVRRTFEVLP